MSAELSECLKLVKSQIAGAKIQKMSLELYILQLEKLLDKLETKDITKD